MTDAMGATRAQPPDGPESRAGKAIVLFADGTGNAFSKQESNVWRLYGALDVSRPSQIAHYIPGVGTSGFRPWALIDGATGLGVPANVRALYEFLCWNYEPGDRIHVFGFSRGAFTVRTLIAMIDSEGLLSRDTPDGPATTAQMRRNVMSAWRAYRSRGKRSLAREAPTITVTRAIRDAFLWVRDRVRGFERYAAVARRSDQDAGIAFVGVFDTVEAYGVPLEEMRDAIDWAIWPIKFGDRRLSAKVEKARHALSLDDERQTFHPLRFDLTDDADWADARIREVWFAGVHSDVGGGYPDDATALVPLAWMLDEVKSDLVFRDDAIASMHKAASALGAIHDSRSGLGVAYRYAPRVIGTSVAEGGAPTVHCSVFEKMVFGSQRYAPHGLPAEVFALLPNGSRRAVEGFGLDDADAPDARGRLRRTAPPSPADVFAAQALAALTTPRQSFVDAVRDGIWLRRKAYFLLLFTVIVIASLPWTNTLLGVRPRAASGGAIGAAGTVVDVNGALVAFVQDIVTTIGSVIPGYLEPWVKAATAQPLLALLLVGLAGALYRLNSRLRDTIADNARAAWFGTPDSQPRRGVFTRCAGVLRHHMPTFGPRGPIYWGSFVATLAGLAIAAALYVDRVALSYRIGTGHLCVLDPAQKPRVVNAGQPETAEGFSPSNPCWDSGLFIEKGRAYALTIEMTQPFLDRSVVSGIAGFDDASWQHWFAAPLKRWATAAYFQPVARIGAQGMTEWPLAPENGEGVRVVDHRARLPGIDESRCQPHVATPDDAASIAAIRKTFGLQTRMTSRFVASASGELFLFVNDAIVANDLFARLVGIDGYDCFYRNNSGQAKIVVELVEPGG